MLIQQSLKVPMWLGELAMARTNYQLEALM